MWYISTACGSHSGVYQFVTNYKPTQIPILKFPIVKRRRKCFFFVKIIFRFNDYFLFFFNRSQAFVTVQLFLNEQLFIQFRSMFIDLDTVQLISLHLKCQEGKKN